MPSTRFITWSEWRKGLDFQNKREVLFTQHPWIEYRRKAGFKPSATRRGTLIFVPHSVPGLSFEHFDESIFFEKALSLPREMHPISFSLHWHDVMDGMAHRMRDKGLSVTSAGDTMSPFFADRFYRMVSKYKFASSSSYGSQINYLHELGIEFFFLPNSQNIRRVGHDFAVESSADLVDRFESIFSFSNLHNADTRTKDELVHSALGLDAPPLDWSKLLNL